MASCITLDPVQQQDTLDAGRILFNLNDEKLAALLCALIRPAYVHVQTTPALVWTINHTLNSDAFVVWYETPTGFQYGGPKQAQRIGTTQLIVTWHVARAGRCVILAGHTGFSTPALTAIGMPTDGSWDDGPAAILPTDSIADALDTMNELLGSLFPPPAPISGDLVPVFALGDGFRTGYISAGQTLTKLVAGSIFNYIFIADIALDTPTLPENQFGRADLGLLEFIRDGVSLDAIDLGPYEPLLLPGRFLELERSDPGVQSWPTFDGQGPNGYLQVLSVEMFLNIPKYQRGLLRVNGFSGASPPWVVEGEHPNIRVRHTVPATPSDIISETNIIDLFRDRSVQASVSGTPTILEATLASSKYIDGIRYYAVGDVFSLAGVIVDPANLTYSAEPARIELPGLNTLELGYVDIGAGFTRDTAFLSDDFNGATVDTAKWATSYTMPVPTSGFYTAAHTSPGFPKTFDIHTVPYLIRGSGFTLRTELEKNAGSSGPGWEMGVLLQGYTGGKLWFIYREGVVGDPELAVYSQADGASGRTLEFTEDIGTLGSVMLELKIVNSGDAYSFSYQIEAGGFIDVGPGPITFAGWGPDGTRRLRAALRVTNEEEAPQPAYNIALVSFTMADGRATLVSGAIPEITDSFDIVGRLVTLDKTNDRSLDAKFTLTPLSPRGVGTPVPSASEKRLVHTYGQVSTAVGESFLDTVYRLPRPVDDFNTAAPSPLTGQWDATVALPAGSAQVYNGALRYPSIDFNTIVAPYHPTQTAGRDYSGRSGPQDYLRAFLPSSPASSGMIQIYGLSSLQLAAGAISMRLKIPNRTGWLSLNAPFDLGTFTGIDDDGIYTGIFVGVGYINVTFTLSTFSTELPSSDTGGVAILEIILPASGAPEITHIQMLSWGPE